MFLGCENGEAGTPNTSTQDAPNDPRISSMPLLNVACESRAMVINPPIAAVSIILGDAFGGRDSSFLNTPFNLDRDCWVMLYLFGLLADKWKSG